MNTINVNGINLAYARRGTGKPLLLIHGFPLDHTSWDQVLPLLENDFDLIVPDLRGFGESTTVESQYTMTDMADDLAGLLDHLGVEKTAVAGHSMGGYVALAFARKYPQRVSALSLISSQAAADPPERKDGRYKTAQNVAEKGVGVVVEAMASKFSENVEVQAVTREVMEKQKPSAMIGALKAMAEREDFVSHLSSFTFPLVLIHGDHDALIPIDRAHEIKTAIQSAHLIEVKDAGHVPMMEFAKETAEALKKLK